MDITMELQICADDCEKVGEARDVYATAMRSAGKEIARLRNMLNAQEQSVRCDHQYIDHHEPGAFRGERCTQCGSVRIPVMMSADERARLRLSNED